MIEPSKGRDDLEYRYEVTVETDALLTSEQHDQLSYGPEFHAWEDPGYESEYPGLDWVRVTQQTFCESSAEKAGHRALGYLGTIIKIDDVFHHLGRVAHVDDDVMCRSTIHVQHRATVPASEWSHPEFPDS